MQSEDYRWFLDNFEKLYQAYGSVFLAIKNKTVLGVYTTYADGVLTTMETEPVGTFIVQKCGEDESAYTNYIASMNFCA